MFLHRTYGGVVYYLYKRTDDAGKRRCRVDSAVTTAKHSQSSWFGLADVPAPFPERLCYLGKNSCSKRNPEEDERLVDGVG
jgi:hypothetical protein